MQASRPERYTSITLGTPYPERQRQRCDLVIGDPAEWAVEVKMLRLLGDNGKLNDNMLIHVLSPYSAHRSALTDVTKLRTSTFSCHLAILIYGFDYEDWPIEAAVQTVYYFEVYAPCFGTRQIVPFDRPFFGYGAAVFTPRELTPSFDHGYPARIIVPALPGVHNTKWVRSIEFGQR